MTIRHSLMAFGLLFTGITALADGPQPAPADAELLPIYINQPLPAWRIFIENPDHQQPMEGSTTRLPKGDVEVNAIQKGGKETALKFAWKDTWRAGMTLEAEEPLDLSGYMNTGVLALDLQVLKLAKGGLSFRMACAQPGCNRVVPFTLTARERINQGWQPVYVPLSCFAQDQDDFSATTIPFALETGGVGEVAVANVRLLKQAPQGASLQSCPDYKTVSVTPDKLNEWWSIDWWLPRHEQKKAEAKAIQQQGGRIDLLFIGDSITQGWEKEGATVWEQYYAKRNGFAIGFGGDRTENVLWRLQHGAVENMSPKVVVMMIGTNNTGHRHEAPPTTAAGIKRLLQELEQRLPSSKVLLLAIFPRDASPEGELRKINAGVNEIIRHYADNKRVFFADVNAVFLDENGVLPTSLMPDWLHPNEKGYAVLAKALELHLQPLME